MDQKVFQMFLQDPAGNVVWSDDVLVQTTTTQQPDALLTRLCAMSLQQVASDEWVDQSGWHYRARPATDGDRDNFSAPRHFLTIPEPGQVLSFDSTYHLYNKPSVSFDGIEQRCDTPLRIVLDHNTEYTKVVRVSVSQEQLAACQTVFSEIGANISLFTNQKNEFMISLYALRRSWFSRKQANPSAGDGLCIDDVLNYLQGVELGPQLSVYVAFVLQSTPSSALVDIEISDGLVLSTSALPLVDLNHLCVSTHWVRDEGLTVKIADVMNDPMLTPVARRTLSALSTLKTPDHQPITYVVFDVTAEVVPGLPSFDW